MADVNQQAPPAPPKAPVPPPPPPAKGGGFSGLRVSLMPQDLEGAGGPDFKLRLLILFLVLIVETGGVLGYQYYLTQQASEREAQREELLVQMERVDEEAAAQEEAIRNALTFSRQLKAVEALLNQHVYASFIMDELMDTLQLPYIEYELVQVDTDSGVVGLDIISKEPDRPHRRLAQQLVKFTESENVLQVRNSSVNAIVSQDGGFGGVNTTVVLKLEPSVWTKDFSDWEATAGTAAAGADPTNL